MASSATAPNSLTFFSSSLFLSSSHQIPRTYISVSKFGSGKASKPLSVASQLATLPIAPTETKQVNGDDSDGFETASEREISDEEGEEHDRVNDAVTSQEEPQHSDKPEKKEELIELMREGEVITDDGPKQPLEISALFVRRS